ncbi:Fibrillin [Phytophthora cinnamomi]|uniref:Fibrillin n=1 Tax=Phytophthora cinnamomi TaxID=4785 RepID=UPI0035594191|nr:Fibrillin [Phytophthora cinnamomi]
MSVGLVLVCVLSLLLCGCCCVDGAVLRRTWTTQPWCESVRKPQWPFAYQKTSSQTLEWQGRVNPNDQDIRHQCSVFGVQSKCHICADFACNGSSGDSCAFQLQGIPWSVLPQNIPTVTDVPWAVGGKHRYDYGSATQLCVFLSGGSCLSPFTTDFSQCDVRCWGTQSGALMYKGVFDPICNASVVATDLNLTSGNITGIDNMASSIVSSGDGCYRCKNGGLCVAPDVCACADGWTGFDCSTPIYPCGTGGGRWGKEEVNGALVGQGNCTLPMKCTCLCKKRYDKAICKATGEMCDKPWHDPFHRSIPAGYVYGTRNCVDGFQGIEDADGNFQSCHLKIYVPSIWRRYTVSVVAILSAIGTIVIVAYYYIRKRVKRALLLAKVERRRSRKNSEENMMKPEPGAFTHAKNE